MAVARSRALAATGGSALALLAASATCAGPQTRPARTFTVAYRFVCEPRDARLIVDEVDQGQCRLWERSYLGLGTGVHRLRIEREGYLPVERELPGSGPRQTVRVQLRTQPE